MTPEQRRTQARIDRARARIGVLAGSGRWTPDLVRQANAQLDAMEIRNLATPRPKETTQQDLKDWFNENVYLVPDVGYFGRDRYGAARLLLDLTKKKEEEAEEEPLMVDGLEFDDWLKAQKEVDREIDRERDRILIQGQEGAAQGGIARRNYLYNKLLTRMGKMPIEAGEPSMEERRERAEETGYTPPRGRQIASMPGFPGMPTAAIPKSDMEIEEIASQVEAARSSPEDAKKILAELSPEEFDRVAVLLAARGFFAGIAQVH